MCNKAHLRTFDLLVFSTFLAIILSGCPDNRGNASFIPSNSGTGANSANTSPPTTLAWDAPTTYVDGSPLLELKEYRVYFSNSPDPYSTGSYYPVPAAATSVEFKDVISMGTGTYFFVVTAVDISGRESDPSNEVSRYLF